MKWRINDVKWWANGWTLWAATQIECDLCDDTNVWLQNEIHFFGCLFIAGPLDKSTIQSGNCIWIISMDTLFKFNTPRPPNNSVIDFPPENAFYHNPSTYYNYQMLNNQVESFDTGKIHKLWFCAWFWAVFFLLKSWLPENVLLVSGKHTFERSELVSKWL